MIRSGFKAGDTPPSNAWYNRVLSEATRTRLNSTGSGLELSGRALSRRRSPRIWGRLSGSAPAYGFQEVMPNASGGFVTLVGGRTDDGGRQPAYEINGGPGLAGTVQRLGFTAAGDWRFRDCTGGGGTPVGGGCLGTIPSCFCTNLPTVLNMTSTDENCNYRMFQSCTISYGPHPGFESLSFGANYYLSDQGFPDPVANGAIFYYALLCQFNQFSLTRSYLTSPYGSPFRDGILYTWLVGGYGNTCASCDDWIVNPDYLTWAGCADDFLNANHPKPGGGLWTLDQGTVDPATGCTTGYLSPGTSGVYADLISACGFPPAVVKCGDPGGVFHLDNGVAFPGSDPTCRVMIDGA
jgi:hypothetical protein